MALLPSQPPQRTPCHANHWPPTPTKGHSALNNIEGHKAITKNEEAYKLAKLGVDQPYNSCHLHETDTWFHLLNKCNNLKMNNICIVCHNWRIWLIYKLLYSHYNTQALILMIGCTRRGLPHYNIIPPWLSTWLCTSQYPCKHTPQTKHYLCKTSSSHLKYNTDNQKHRQCLVHWIHNFHVIQTFIDTLEDARRPTSLVIRGGYIMPTLMLSITNYTSLWRRPHMHATQRLLAP